MEIFWLVFIFIEIHRLQFDLNIEIWALCVFYSHFPSSPNSDYGVTRNGMGSEQQIVIRKYTHA